MMMSSVYLTKSLGTMGRSYKFEREWGKRPPVKTKKTREQSRPSKDQHTEDLFSEYEDLEQEALDEELKERIKNRR